MIPEYLLVSIQGQMETSSISQHVLMCSTTGAAALQILSLSPAPGLKGMGGGQEEKTQTHQLQGESQGGGPACTGGWPSSLPEA